MVLNQRKCERLSFSGRNILLIRTSWRMWTHSLIPVICWTIQFDSNHILSNLGFIKRRSRVFTDPYVAKLLYMNRLRMKCPLTLWLSSCCCHVDSTESLQKQFLPLALRNLNWNRLVTMPLKTSYY